MRSDLKAETAQPKGRKQAKAGTLEKQHISATDGAPHETGGPKGLEPTRYGDWENNGRCTDF